MFGRVLLIAFAAVGLASCSSDSTSDWSMLFEAAKSYWKGPASISVEQAATIPYATIGIRLDDGPQGLLVLATDVSGDRFWTSGQHIALRTRAGRIVQSVGLGHDLYRVHGH